MDDLKNKINLVKDEHAAGIVDQKGRDLKERKLAEAMFFLGRVKQIGHDARSIATSLTAQEVRALEHFQEAGMYKTLGYATFVDFLDNSEYSPMSKRQYYERRELMNAHGDEIYDLLTSVGISVRSQKLLGSGELAIKGDRLVIGDTEVDVANTGVIKDVLNELFDDRRALQEKAVKDAKKIADQADQIDHGSQDLESLQRRVDELTGGDPLDIAFSNALHSMLVLQESAGQADDATKAARGGTVCREIFRQLQLVSRSFGYTASFEDAAAASAAPISDDVSRILNEDDDFGDDEEVAK